jgi:alpha-amylase
MRTISLIFGTNNGIATGTPEEQIEQLYQRAYKPFLTTLYTFPDIFLTLHYNGVLLEWFQERHPEFIMLLNEMIKRGQIELLGGTFYETVLPLIPSSDRTAQIELLTTMIRRRFGKRPRGAWVTELIWEPAMPSSLKRSGMEYIFLGDGHFIEAGLRENELLEPVFTEDQGKMLLVFPISPPMWSSSLSPTILRTL